MNISNVIYNQQQNYLTRSIPVIKDIVIKVVSFAFKVFLGIATVIVVSEIIDLMNRVTKVQAVNNRIKDFSNWGDFKTDSGLELKLPGIPKKEFSNNLKEKYLYQTEDKLNAYQILTKKCGLGQFPDTDGLFDKLSNRPDTEVIPEKTKKNAKGDASYICHHLAIYHKTTDIYEYLFLYEDKDGIFHKSLHTISIVKCAEAISDEEYQFFTKNIKRLVD